MLSINISYGVLKMDRKGWKIFNINRYLILINFLYVTYIYITIYMYTIYTMYDICILCILYMTFEVFTYLQYLNLTSYWWYLV